MERGPPTRYLGLKVSGFPSQGASTTSACLIQAYKDTFNTRPHGCEFSDRSSSSYANALILLIAALSAFLAARKHPYACAVLSALERRRA